MKRIISILFFSLCASSYAHTWVMATFRHSSDGSIVATKVYCTICGLNSSSPVPNVSSGGYCTCHSPSRSVIVSTRQLGASTPCNNSGVPSDADENVLAMDQRLNDYISETPDGATPAIDFDSLGNNFDPENNTFIPLLSNGSVVTGSDGGKYVVTDSADGSGRYALPLDGGTATGYQGGRSGTYTLVPVGEGIYNTTFTPNWSGGVSSHGATVSFPSSGGGGGSSSSGGGGGSSSSGGGGGSSSSGGGGSSSSGGGGGSVFITVNNNGGGGGSSASASASVSFSAPIIFGGSSGGSSSSGGSTSGGSSSSGGGGSSSSGGSTSGGSSSSGGGGSSSSGGSTSGGSSSSGGGGSSSSGGFYYPDGAPSSSTVNNNSSVFNSPATYNYFYDQPTYNTVSHTTTGSDGQEVTTEYKVISIPQQTATLGNGSTLTTFDYSGILNAIGGTLATGFERMDTDLNIMNENQRIQLETDQAVDVAEKSDPDIDLTSDQEEVKDELDKLQEKESGWGFDFGTGKNPIGTIFSKLFGNPVLNVGTQDQVCQIDFQLSEDIRFQYHFVLSDYFPPAFRSLMLMILTIVFAIASIKAISGAFQ